MYYYFNSFKGQYLNRFSLLPPSNIKDKPMIKLALTGTASLLFALAAPIPASATDMTTQINLCEAEIAQAANLAELSNASVKFRSSGGNIKRKKLSFTLRADEGWGTAQCTIVNDEIQKVRYPSKFSEQIRVAQSNQETRLASGEASQIGYDE